MHADKQQLLQDLDGAIGRAKAVEWVVPDDTGFFALQNDLLARVQEVIQETLALMRRAQALYDEEGSEDAALPLEPPDATGGEDDFLRHIGAAISSELAAQEVSNTAFGVRMQLKESADALRGALEGDHIWIVASHADAGLRRAGKGLITLEATIREYEGLEPVERTWSPLDDSLETRRLYCQFRRGILRLGDPGDESLDTAEAMRRAAHRIAILRDRKIYPLMRVSDRIPIRRLQKRILAWLDRPDSADREQEGRRLWGDLLSFAELLRQVNHREELREHDRRLVGEWLGAHFPESGPASPATPDFITDLEPLLGCSDELDELLIRPEERTPEDFRGPLERLFRQLNRPFEPAEVPLAPLM